MNPIFFDILIGIISIVTGWVFYDVFFKELRK